MIVTIIGWYGTETIGDRAILAGIFSVLSKSIGSCNIQLGSLNPIYTQRVVLEDLAFYRACSNNPLFNITIFDSQSLSEIRRAVRHSDFLLIGGGPLMDLREMRMLDFAFSYAKRCRVKKALLGCGWGPLRSEESINIASRLVSSSTLTIFRDEISKSQCKSILPDAMIYSIIDPAFIACNYFRSQNVPDNSSDYIAVNFRDVFVEADHYAQGDFRSRFVKILEQLQEVYKCPIKLVPMHNFPIGGDDRIFMDCLCRDISSNLLEVVWETQSLYETMCLYANAKACVGMRFHSVVLQTVLNGNNYIVDYTDPKKGKIVGMLGQIDPLGFYNKRYMSLYDDNSCLHFMSCPESNFVVSSELLDNYETQYVSLVKKVLFS